MTRTAGRVCAGRPCPVNDPVLSGTNLSPGNISAHGMALNALGIQNDFCLGGTREQLGFSRTEA